MKLITWQNCYDNQWSGLIVPEAFSHPAKFSPGLIQKIYSYGIEQGWFAAGDVIGDPFGGIGGGGIFAAFAKLQWIGLELESKFVDLAKQNIELHRATWEAHGYPVPVILQGDSRRFSEIVGKCAAICTSPPWETTIAQNKEFLAPHQRQEYGRKENSPSILADTYGQTPGQIGKLKAGDLGAIVTSPPYAEGLGHGGTPTHKGKAPDKNLDAMQKGYSDNPANIGNLKMDGIVTSPPFMSSDNRNADKTVFANKFHGNQRYSSYDPVNSSIGGDRTSVKAIIERKIKAESTKNIGNIVQSGNSGNLCNVETYWQAMTQVYSECYKSLKPGGHMIVVVKAYVKNKKRVPLPQQTLKLLIHLGFEPVERIKAMLTKESVNSGLFGEDIISKKERKSFFRRLAERKGSPKIDFEEILVVRK